MTAAAPPPPSLVAFGCGYVALALAKRLADLGVSTLGTARTEAGAAALRAEGVGAAVWTAGAADPPGSPPGAAWLISVPPDDGGCPAARALAGRAAEAGWIGYLSTTGVYGDLGGRWAFEEMPANPQSEEARRRLVAETQWRAAGAHVFRLPGIYGPGRSALERVSEPGARRIVKPGQVFSRAHRDDIAAALLASLRRPNPARVYNVCDDLPAPADLVLAHAAELLGVAPPPEVAFEAAELSPMARRFYAERKRVSNARIKAELGWRPAFPTFREGLADCLQARAAST
jgi:dTDP-4-dehydrorhamnose reductase